MTNSDVHSTLTLLNLAALAGNWAKKNTYKLAHYSSLFFTHLLSSPSTPPYNGKGEQLLSSLERDPSHKHDQVTTPCTRERQGHEDKGIAQKE